MSTPRVTSPVSSLSLSSRLQPAQVTPQAMLQLPAGSGDDGGGAPRAGLERPEGADTADPQEGVLGTAGVPMPTVVTATSTTVIETLADQELLAPTARPDYFAEDAVLRARERRCEQELMERERTIWEARVRMLEGECSELDRAISMTRTEGKALETAATQRWVMLEAEERSAAASVRADTSEAYLEVRSMEREEALLEAGARERMQTSVVHANNARTLQSRAEVLQASASREAEASESLATELHALEARALVEERRCAHEQRGQTLHLQVTESAVVDAENSAAEVVGAAHREEEEDTAKHAAAMRRWRVQSVRRLAALEEEEAAKWQSRSLLEARGAAHSADTSASEMMAKLRSQHATNCQHLASAREHALAELRTLEEEHRELNAGEGELEIAEAATASASEAITIARTTTTALACRCAVAERQVREYSLEDLTCLAETEARIAWEFHWSQLLEVQSQAVEERTMELRRRLAGLEESAASQLETLRRELARAVEDGFSVEAGIQLELQAAANAAAREKAISECGNREMLAAETACAMAAADAEVHRSGALDAARLHRDRNLHMLGELRLALRQQHEQAEAAHAAAIGDEQQAERILMQMQLIHLT